MTAEQRAGNKDGIPFPQKPWPCGPPLGDAVNSSRVEMVRCFCRPCHGRVGTKPQERKPWQENNASQDSCGRAAFMMGRLSDVCV